MTTIVAFLAMLMGAAFMALAIMSASDGAAAGFLGDDLAGAAPIEATAARTNRPVSTDFRFIRFPPVLFFETNRLGCADCRPLDNVPS
jgi:hypothetical protein